MAIHSLNDIKRYIAELDPAKSQPQHDVKLNAKMEAPDENGKVVTYAVSANTRSKSKRDMLLEGFAIIKSRMEKLAHADVGEDVEINGRLVTPPKLGDSVAGHSWIDPLIRQWLGGTRDGMLICWNLDGYRYMYDIFTHKLTRVVNDVKTS